MDQTRADQRALEGRATCTVCGEGCNGARCENCGVAVAPGGWRIIRQIAKGPHSRVFLAEKNGQQVALKELVFALVPEASQLEGFEREAKLLAQLRHPAIPRLIEFFKEGQGIHTRLYLAQEFVRGESLLARLDSHRFDESEAKVLARELLEVLRYLHGLSPRVIHRDIKPANVMRRDDGSLALVDFGSARDLVGGVTHGSTLVGTFGYMPPEQLGGTVDVTSDLYAVGATLVHLLSRKSPDEMLKPGMELVFEGEVNVSSGLLAWLRKLLKRDPKARYRNAEGALDALAALEQPVRTRAATPRPDAKAGPPLVAIISVLGLIAGIAGASFLTRLPPAPPPGPRAFDSATLAPRAPLSSPAPRAKPVVPVVPAAPGVRVAPLVPAMKSTDVVTMPTPKVLPPFVLEHAFTAELDTSVTLADRDAAGALCLTPSSLALKRLRAAPGSPGKLMLDTELSSRGDSRGCSNVYVELRDQNGVRSTATLLSNASANSTQKIEVALALPENSQRVELRLGPTSKPYAVLEVDLVAQSVVRR